MSCEFRCAFSCASSALLVLAGCGASSHLSPHIIEAPEGSDRWEPSGAVVIGDRLWVANDREAWIASYQLPLVEGVNRPVDAAQLSPPKLDRVKWEGAAPAPGGGLFLLEAFSRSVWRCRDPSAGCPGLERLTHTERLNPQVDALAPEPFDYIAFEGLAADGERLWVGTRALAPENRALPWYPWTLLFGPDGALAPGYDRGKPWTVGGRDHGLSAMAFDGRIMWMLWSFEEEDDKTTAGVGGVLARASIDAKGRIGPPTACATFAGKPEGLAVWGDLLIVTFDLDRDRKRPDHQGYFQVNARQDYVAVISKPKCD